MEMFRSADCEKHRMTLSTDALTNVGDSLSSGGGARSGRSVRAGDTRLNREGRLR